MLLQKQARYPKWLLFCCTFLFLFQLGNLFQYSFPGCLSIGLSTITKASHAGIVTLLKHRDCIMLFSRLSFHDLVFHVLCSLLSFDDLLHYVVFKHLCFHFRNGQRFVGFWKTNQGHFVWLVWPCLCLWRSREGLTLLFTREFPTLQCLQTSPKSASIEI